MVGGPKGSGSGTEQLSDVSVSNADFTSATDFSGPYVSASPSGMSQETDRITKLLAPLIAAVDGLLDFDFAAVNVPEILDAVRRFEQQKRRLFAVDHRVVLAVSGHSVADIRGIDNAAGSANTGVSNAVAVLTHQVQITPGEAKARCTAALELGPRTSVLGERLEPVFPAIAAAQLAGGISLGHIQVIRRFLRELAKNPALYAEHAVWAEKQLVGFAQQMSPTPLKVAAGYLLDHLDPDGAAPRDDAHQRNRTLRWHTNLDGTTALIGIMTPELAAVLITLLDSLSAPRPAEDGTPDTRTAGQRSHDALLDACRRSLSTGDLPNSGGVPATLILTMTEAQFAAKTGCATTAHGDLVPYPAVERIVDQADVITVVLNPAGGITSYGRTKRCASTGQRLALHARDRGCSFPGCDIPPTWTEAHHVQSWLDGGNTELNNLTLLCGHHHRNFESMGWEVVMKDRIPWWIPPSWWDPDQHPIQNYVHQIGHKIGHNVAETTATAAVVCPEFADL